jgi:hypothetical protein
MFAAALFGPAFVPAALLPVVKISRELVAPGGNTRVNPEAAGFAVVTEAMSTGDAVA